MYLLFRYNKLTSPSEFKKLKTGEKIILAAFIEEEIEERQQYGEIIQNIVS